MRKPPTPTIVTLVVFTTVTVILWIFISVYNILINKPVVDVPQELLEPINASLDTAQLQKISEKVFFEEGQETPFSVPPQISVEQPTATTSASQ